MTYSGALTRLEQILTAAGTATSPTITTIQYGEPGIPPKSMIAFWYEGDDENPLIGETLTDHPFVERFTIRAYWSVSTRAGAPARALDGNVRTFTRTLRAALYADRDLNSQAELEMIGRGEAGWLNSGDSWFRTLTLEVQVGFTDTEPNTL